jgi:flotillin
MPRRAAEVRAEAAGQQARAEAELTLQQISRRARAAWLRPRSRSRPRSTRIRELIRGRSGELDRRRRRGDGESLAEVASAWKDSGGKAMDMFVLQHLDTIFVGRELASRIRSARSTWSTAGMADHRRTASYPATMAALLEQVTKTLGVDIRKVITGIPTPNGTTPAVRS